jgi:hypothetical protein
MGLHVSPCSSSFRSQIPKGLLKNSSLAIVVCAMEGAGPVESCAKIPLVLPACRLSLTRLTTLLENWSPAVPDSVRR